VVEAFHAGKKLAAKDAIQDFDVTPEITDRANRVL